MPVSDLPSCGERLGGREASASRQSRPTRPALTPRQRVIARRAAAAAGQADSGVVDVDVEPRRALGETRPAASPAPVPVPAPAPASSTHVKPAVARADTSPPRIFADRVAEKLSGGLVHYSDRVKLLRLAEVLGIGRFDANLIIAAVQNHACAAASPSAPAPRRPAQRASAPPVTPQTGGAFRAISLFAMVQAGITIACWWLLTR